VEGCSAFCSGNSSCRTTFSSVLCTRTPSLYSIKSSSKAIHEEVDAGPGRTDHFRQGFLRDLRNERSGSPGKPKFRHRQEISCQTLFAGVEELIDQIGLGSHAAREQKLQEQVDNAYSSCMTRTISEALAASNSTTHE
jgi:hypothetical protein